MDDPKIINFPPPPRSEAPKPDEPDEQLRPPGRRYGGNSPRRLGAVIALAGLLVTAGIYVALRPPSATQLANNTHSTLPDEHRVVTLSDGTRVVLDEQTEIIEQFSDTTRRVVLKGGRAHFAVSKEKRTFIVTAENREIVALGTAFTVTLRPTGKQVLLHEGQVCVRDIGSKDLCGFQDGPKGGALLLPRQMIQLSSWKLASGAKAIAREQEWASGFLALYNIPLRRAIDKVNRYSRRDILFLGNEHNDRNLGTNAVIGDSLAVADHIERSGIGRIARVTNTQIVIVPVTEKAMRSPG